jgi:hypothetical protein
MRCPINDHEIYLKRPHAVRDMKKMIARVKKSGEGGDSWRQLNIWKCPRGHWHVGRSKLITPAPAPPEKRPPVFAKIKRKIRIMEREWTRQQRERAAFIGQLIELERKMGLL